MDVLPESHKRMSNEKVNMCAMNKEKAFDELPSEWIRSCMKTMVSQWDFRKLSKIYIDIRTKVGTTREFFTKNEDKEILRL